MWLPDRLMKPPHALCAPAVFCVFGLDESLLGVLLPEFPPRLHPRVVVLLAQLVHLLLQLLDVGLKNDRISETSSDTSPPHLRPVVQLQYPDGDVSDLRLGGAEDRVPGRVLGQGQLELAGGQVDARARHRLRLVPHEHVRPQRVVHVVPRVLHQLLVLLEAEDLQVHHDYLRKRALVRRATLAPNETHSDSCHGDR
jgi:hypothetical protein